MIGILLISTGKYKQFVRPFIESLRQHFFKHASTNVYLFTDEYIPTGAVPGRITVSQYLIPSYRFPDATLYRYRIFISKSYDCDYLFYFDVDMKIVADIGKEFLGDIVAVAHPGFDKVGGGSWELRSSSKCYTANKKKYYAGGVQGGKAAQYLAAMIQMRDWIDEDVHNGIMPVWHDESAWNCYLSKLDNFHALDCSYCMVEQMDLRRKWKIDDLEPKIIALAKDHQKIRE